MQLPGSSSSPVSMVFVLATLFTAQLVGATECTDDDLMQMTVGANSVTLESSLSCISSFYGNNYCDDKECLDLFSELLESVPDCTISGYTMDEIVSELLDFCAMVSEQAIDSDVGSSSSDSASSASNTGNTEASTAAASSSASEASAAATSSSASEASAAATSSSASETPAAATSGSVSNTTAEPAVGSTSDAASTSSSNPTSSDEGTPSSTAPSESVGESNSQVSAEGDNADTSAAPASMNTNAATLTFTAGLASCLLAWGL